MSELIVIHYSNKETDDEIQALWALMRFVRGLPDEPTCWKLTDRYIRAICKFLCSSEKEILTSHFIDVPIDKTGLESCLICENSKYPVSLVGYQNL